MSYVIYRYTVVHVLSDGTEAKTTHNAVSAMGAILAASDRLTIEDVLGTRVVRCTKDHKVAE